MATESRSQRQVLVAFAAIMLATLLALVVVMRTMQPGGRTSEHPGNPRNDSPNRIYPLIGSTVVLLGTTLLTTLDTQTSRTLASAYLVVIGVGMGLMFQTFVIATQNRVDPAGLGVATAAIQFFPVGHARRVRGDRPARGDRARAGRPPTGAPATHQTLTGAFNGGTDLRRCRRCGRWWAG